MAKLLEDINSDLKVAMQAKNELKVSVLRMLMSAIKNKEISLRKGEEVELDDSQVQEVIQSEVKKQKDSIQSFEKAGRQDLADKEKAEIKILEKYMPEQLSDEELGQIVKEIVDSSDRATAHDFGQIMGLVMQKAKGKADGGKVSEIVKKVLGN